MERLKNTEGQVWKYRSIIENEAYHTLEPLFRNVNSRITFIDRLKRTLEAATHIQNFVRQRWETRRLKVEAFLKS